jgi:hypothetical protein
MPQPGGTMPSGLIEEQDGVDAGRDIEGDFLKVHAHGLALMQRGMTIPAPLPSAGQTAPKIQA